MKKQKIDFKRSFRNIFVLCFFLLMLAPFSFVLKASAQNVIKISTGNYIPGQWTNKTVSISASLSSNFKDADLFYSLDNWQTSNNYQVEFQVENDGEYLIEFKAVLGEQTYFETVSVKIDKAPPIIEKVELSRTDYTSENLFVLVYLADSSNYKQDYRASFFGGEQVSPIKENLDKGIISFCYEVQQNIVFDIGDLVVFDHAGNKTIYNEKIEVVNIDKTEPEFRLEVLETASSAGQEIRITLGRIDSQAKQIFVKTPDEQIINLKLQPQQTFIAKANGVYIFTVVSNAGHVHSRGVLVKNLNSSLRLLPYVVVTLVMCSFITLAIIGKIAKKQAMIKSNKR